MHSEFRRFDKQVESGITAKGMTREELKRQTKEFLKRGGEIEKLAFGMRREDPFAGSKNFNGAIAGERQ